MSWCMRNCLRSGQLLFPCISFVSHTALSRICFIDPASCFPSLWKITQSVHTAFDHQEQSQYSIGQSYLELLISKIHVGSSVDEVFQLLLKDEACNGIQMSENIVDKLFHRFKDDWKSALGIFRWLESRSDYKLKPEAYDRMVDILGKYKQIDKMRLLIDDMCRDNCITLNTIAKVMRRLAGAGRWEDAIKTFNDLGTLGLEKNTESMNLLLDTLCKETKVELAREIFMELKLHLSPDAHTFNIFIHGWCKANRVDEAHWTIQEMKGHGFRPCVISYSTIIQAYCKQSKFHKVYELLDEMQAQGCPPNVVTYTSVMHSLAKSENFDEALQLCERMKSTGCKPDTLFYNSLIHILGRTGRVGEAVHVFKVEMPMNGVAPNTSTYNSMIAMFCHHSQEHSALNILSEMGNLTYCKPDVQTYYPLLKMSFKTGKTDSNLSNLLSDMVNKHHLSLDLSTYTLLIHGLCRANKCEWAYQLFEEMINQEIIPRYLTCCLLLEEVKQKCMYDTAERIELLLRHKKTSS